MQMRTFFGKFFLAVVLFFSVFLGNAVSMLGQDVPAAAAKAGSEKLFYSATLNESLFISDKEMLCNVRVSVKTLQGNLDAVTFEMLGQGEIENVNGDQVKDWGIRKSGARRFLEIRPKTAVGAGAEFNATIVGKLVIDLPTTMFPPIFAGVDATAFTGIVRIVSIPDLRLYARQSRGLIPVGVATQNELSFGVTTSPLLRLDVARANELLAPVALESFSLHGKVEQGFVRFRMRATASVREVGAEIPVLSGEAALRNFPADSVFSVRTEVNPKTKIPTYFLKFPQRGDFDFDLEFDARVQDLEGWRALDFAVPAVQVAPFSLIGLEGDILFAPSSVSVPQKIDDAYQGFLPANGEFNLRWREVSGTPPEFSACVFSADTCGEWRVATGMLKRREEIQLMISQGTLSNLAFELYGDGDILNVSGEDVLAWHVETFSDKTRELHIALSQKKRGAYSLYIESQTAFKTLPAVIHPLRAVPQTEQPDSAVCVRVNEFLRLRNDGFVRIDVVPQSGLTQVAPSAFPQKSDYFEKNVPAENLVVYRLAAGTKGLSVQVNQIKPDVSVKQATRCYFDDEKIIALTRLDMTIRSAPLYEWTMRIPEDFSLASVDSEKMASYEVGSASNGFRDVKIVFTEPLLGGHELIFSTKKDGISTGGVYEIQGVRYPQARFVSGFVGLGGSQKVRLLPLKMGGLTEVPVEFYPQKRSGSLPQQVFRVREAAWRASMRVEKMLTELHGNVSTVYEISPERIRGNAEIRYDSGNELVGEIRFALPNGAKFLQASGDGIGESVERDGVWIVPLSTPKRGKFSAVVEFEMPSAPRGALAEGDFSGLRLLDVSGESGSILITGTEPVAIASAEDAELVAGNDCAKPQRVMKLSRIGVPEADFATRGGPVLLGAYQYVERPFAMNLKFSILPEKTFPPTVVTAVDARIERRRPANSLTLICNYSYLNTDSKGSMKELVFRIPEGVQFDSSQAGVSENGDGTYSVAIGSGAGTFELVCYITEPAKRVAFGLPVFDVPVLKARVAVDGEFVGVDFKNGRTLNENWKSFSERVKKIFIAWDLGAIFVTAACVFLGTLLLLLTMRLHSVLHFIVGVGATLSLGTLLAGGSFVLLRAASPVYQASAADFMPGDIVNVVAEIWLPVLQIDEGMALLIVASGIVLLSLGSVLVRSAVLRAVGRILFYSFALLLVQDLEHHIPGVVIVILAVDTLLLLVDFCFSLKRKFSKSHIPAEVKSLLLAGALFFGAGTVFPPAELHAADAVAEEELLNEDFEALAVQSETHGDDAEVFSRPQNIAERISQTMKILSDRVVAAGEIRVKGRAGERFDLLASPAVLTKFEKSTPEAAIRLERRRGKGGIVYQVVLERAGTFSANFAYELALRQDSRGITLLTGNAAADVATLVILRSDVRVSAEGIVTLDVAKEAASSQVAQIVFKPVEERKIFWNPRERDRSGEPLHLFSEGTDLYVPAAGVIEGYHTLRLVPAQGEFDSVSVKIPEPFSVSRVEGNSIRRWNFGRDRMLTILLDSKKSEPIELSIYTQAALDVSTPYNFSALSALGCEQSVRTLGIATGGDLQVDEISAPKMVALDAKEFPKKLVARATANEPSAQLRRAFRSITEDALCRVFLSEVKPNLRISSESKIVLNRDKISLAAVLTAQVSRADVFSLTFVLPEGLEVESVSGEALGYWSESQEGEVRKVTLYLKKQFSGEEKFTVELAGAFPVGVQTWSMPRIIFDDAKQQFGEVFLFTEEGLQLSLRSRDDAVETLPADGENAELRKADFAVRHFGRKWNAVFNIGSSRTRAEAGWTMEIFPRGRYALVDAKIVYAVENAMRQVVRVRLPKNAIAPRFSGDQVINAELVQGEQNENVREVRLAKPMRGEIPFSVQYFIPFCAETEIQAIAVDGVERETGTAIVFCGDVLDMTGAPAKATGFSKSDDGSWIAKDFVGKKVAVKAFPSALADWKNAEADISDGTFTDVESRRFSFVSAGESLTEEQLHIKVGNTELLRIVPGNAKILGALVNGVPAKLFSDDSTVFYLPLYKTLNGKKLVVSLLYRNAFGGDGLKMLVPVRTSAVPGSVCWGFARSSKTYSLVVGEIFGSSSAGFKASNTAWEGDFLSGESELKFESAGGVDGEAPAAVECRAIPAVTEKSHADFFLALWGMVIFCKILCTRPFRRKKAE